MVPGGGSLRESVRFWWIRNGERVGLAIAPLLLIVILPFFVPLGRSAPRTGVVHALRRGANAPPVRSDPQADSPPPQPPQ